MSISRKLEINKLYFSFFSFVSNRSRDFIYIVKSGAPIYLIVSYFLTLGRYINNRSFYIKNKKSVSFKLNQIGDFSTDWFSPNTPYWLNVFENEGFHAREIMALEVGSWEGRSACFLLEYLPNSCLVAVDTWAGSDEHGEDEVRSIEARFDKNVRQFGDRLSKYKGTSSSFFLSYEGDPEFDLIYIDGSHHADDVICDAIGAFRFLKSGGILIFDDYLWRFYGDSQDNPATALHAFLRMKRGEYEIVSVHHQLCLKKTKATS